MLKYNLLLALAAAFFFVGCGANGQRTAPVSGTVTYKGKSLPGAIVSFAPEDPSGRIAMGIADSSGQFKLGTLSTDDGAIVGKYKVTVIARGPDRPAKPGEGSGMPGETVPGDPLIPAKYFSPESSGLVQEVKSGRNTVELKLD